MPPHSRYATEELLAQLEQVVAGIGRFEQRMREVFAPSEKLQLIETLPGVGFILAVVILVEVGDVERFARAEQLAAYAGTTPRVIASGGKMWFGPLITDVNHYLKWAFVEAANSICLHRQYRPYCHASLLYERVRPPSQTFQFSSFCMVHSPRIG